MRKLVVLLAALLTGCASYSPSVHESTASGTVVYQMPVDQAKRVVSTTMASHFAGREVLPLEGAAIGYTTYTRQLMDTWTTTVTIVPVRAKVASAGVDAVKIEVRGSGSSFVTGRVVYEGFKTRLREALDATATMRIADSYVAL